LLLGGAVAAILVIGFILSLFVSEPPDVPASSVELSAPGSAISIGDAPPVATSAAPSGVDRAADILKAGHRALEAWAAFANTGRSDPLFDLIHPLSPQLPLFERQSAKMGVIVRDGEPFHLTMEDPAVKPTSPGFVRLEGPVVTTRGTEVVSQTRWRVVLTWSEERGRWMVWTLEETE
jgi:hypothetical protein